MSGIPKLYVKFWWSLFWIPKCTTKCTNGGRGGGGGGGGGLSTGLIHIFLKNTHFFTPSPISFLKGKPKDNP